MNNQVAKQKLIAELLEELGDLELCNASPDQLRELSIQLRLIRRLTLKLLEKP